MRRRLGLLCAAIAFLAAIPGGAGAAAEDGYVHLIGALHEHSGYSDGWPGSTPEDYYASAKSFGIDFLGSGEHSDNSQVPVVLSDYCLTAEDAAKCGIADDENPINSFRKWDATLEYARAASDENFTGIRGFEWTSDVFGHINVYFSRHDENAKEDGGYGATTKTFYAWFSAPHEAGGGDDGIATFNHPGDKCRLGREDATCDWNHFEYVPEADQRMVGIELYNGTQDFGPYYVEALDKGWHVGAVGAEDKGHGKEDRWGGPEWAKTVILAPVAVPACTPSTPGTLPDPAAPTCAELRYRDAMLARHTYAVQAGANDIRIHLDADGELMGARLSRAPGEAFPINATVTGGAARLELVSNGGAVVASADGDSLTYVGAGMSAERYYFLRVLDAAGKPVAYSSPVWVRP